MTTCFIMVLCSSQVIWRRQPSNPQWIQRRRTSVIENEFVLARDSENETQMRSFQDWSRRDKPEEKFIWTMCIENSNEKINYKHWLIHHLRTNGGNTRELLYESKKPLHWTSVTRIIFTQLEVVLRSNAHMSGGSKSFSIKSMAPGKAEIRTSL